MKYAFVEELIKVPSVRSILEVGGGEYLDVFPHKVYHSGDIKHGIDVHDLPYPDNSFDLVFGQDVFHILKDPKRAIEECCRVSKGEVWVFDFQPGPQIERETRTPVNRHIWTSTQLRCLFPPGWKTRDRTFAYYMANRNLRGRIHYVLKGRPQWLVIQATAR